MRSGPTENIPRDTPSTSHHRDNLGGNLLPMPSSPRLPARLSPRPVRVLRRRLARSPFTEHLRLNGGLLAGCLLILAMAATVALLSRGHAVTWEGVIDVTPGATRGNS